MELTPFQLGTSVQGRPIAAFKGGDGADVVAVIGAVHGDERATFGLVDWLMLSMVEFESTGQTLIFLPLANPDGWEAETRTNANGVDINRNFPVGWVAGYDEKSKNPGPSAASEPETLALMKLVNDLKPSRILTIHQPSHSIDYDGPQGFELAELMAGLNGLPIKKLEGSFPGSFGRYCESVGVSVVTLEMAKLVLANEAWHQQRAAMQAFVKGLS